MLLFPILVRCGCLGCLTDDCEYWGTEACTLKDYTPCLLGRISRDSDVIDKSENHVTLDA